MLAGLFGAGPGLFVRVDVIILINRLLFDQILLRCRQSRNIDLIYVYKYKLLNVSFLGTASVKVRCSEYFTLNYLFTLMANISSQSRVCAYYL